MTLAEKTARERQLINSIARDYKIMSSELQQLPQGQKGELIAVYEGLGAVLKAALEKIRNTTKVDLVQQPILDTLYKQRKVYVTSFKNAVVFLRALPKNFVDGLEEKLKDYPVIADTNPPSPFFPKTTKRSALRY